MPAVTGNRAGIAFINVPWTSLITVTKPDI